MTQHDAGIIGTGAAGGTLALRMYTFVLAVFFASGFCGLVYQVVWVKMLGTVFGVTTLAASAVLGAYFGGLALGGYLGGRLADRHASLRLYGVIEVALGVLALAVPQVLEGLTSIYRGLHLVMANTPSVLIPARFLLSFAVLVVPATLIGMALPVLTRTLTDRYDEIGQKLPRLYGWNTFGSVLGAVLTGYIFIGFLGITLSMYIAVAINLTVGVVAMLASGVPTPSGGMVERVESTPRASSANWHRVALAVTFCSGFAALGYEVAWFRVLTLLSDHRAHTFSGIVAVVLLGIGAGSLAVVKLNRRSHDPVSSLAAVQLGLGALGFLWLPLIVGVSAVVGVATGALSQTQGKSGIPFAIALAVTLLPCLLMGMSFPLAVQVYTRRSAGVGQSVGRMYSLNLVGATLGSVLTGFVLLPSVGAQDTLFLLPLMCFLAAGLLYHLDGRRRLLSATAVLAVLALATAASAPRVLFDALFLSANPRARVLKSYEDIEATVTVAESASHTVMYINGSHQADDSPEMVNAHRMIGLVPCVVHGDVRDALVVGMGGGTTGGQIAQCTRDTLTIVEISPSVVEAARAFGAHNRKIADSPDADIVIADGRNYLLLTTRMFDLITADTISPLHAHSSNLYSLDYYRLMASHLKNKGIVIQWIDASLEEHEQRILMRTFVSAFPHVAMWDRGIRLLIGSNQPISADRESIAARYIPHAVGDLVFPGVADAPSFLAHLTVADDAVRAAIGSGPVISDDRPYNEYFNLLRILGSWRLLPAQSPTYRPSRAADLRGRS